MIKLQFIENVTCTNIRISLYLSGLIDIHVVVLDDTPPFDPVIYQ